MRQSENLYRAFLDEMRALENFRTTYSGLHPSASLHREDPDVRRLIEAMAFFTARTRTSGLRNILATRRRLFQQYFSFLLEPLPAMGLLEATTTGRFAEPALLPAGAEIALRPPEGPTAMFRTLWDLRLLPVRMRSAEMSTLRGGAPRLMLHFETPYPRSDDIGRLSLHVSHMGSYHASLHILAGLRDHSRGAFVCFDERVTEDSSGPPCPVHFGVPAEAVPPSERPPHPIEAVRDFMRFPEQSLYVSFDVPRPPRNWKRFSICLDLDERWPKSLRLHGETFKLFVVPMVNLRRSMAEPIACDGTRDRYAIRSPFRADGFELHSVLGAYLLEKEGMSPLRPGVIAGGGGSYEVEIYTGEVGDRREMYLNVDLPDAFEAPRKVAVDALWYQPGFTEHASARVAVAVRDRVIAGVDFDILGEARGHLDNALQDDTEALLRVLSLKHKAVLDLDELKLLLSALGGIEDGHFRSIPEHMLGLDVRTVPLASAQGGGIKHIYQLRMKAFEDTYRPVVEVALRQLCALLNCWIADAVVELEAYPTGARKPWLFTPEAGRAPAG